MLILSTGAAAGTCGIPALHEGSTWRTIDSRVLLQTITGVPYLANCERADRVLSDMRRKPWHSHAAARAPASLAGGTQPEQECRSPPARAHGTPALAAE